MYLDLSFFNALARRFGAPGDFAAAYVIAHELGHHVQDELGIESAVREKQQGDPANANKWSVALELQADCFAGVWAHSTYERGILEAGDIDEGLTAAAAVGDDRLGARSREQWTHGSSELRTDWFREGFRVGRRRLLRHVRRRRLLLVASGRSRQRCVVEFVLLQHKRSATRELRGRSPDRARPRRGA